MLDLTLLQNVSGRTLVGLRFWNQVRHNLSLNRPDTNCVQVDEDGDSYWVFESRDVSELLRVFGSRNSCLSPMQPSRPANPVDSK